MKPRQGLALAGGSALVLLGTAACSLLEPPSQVAVITPAPPAPRVQAGKVEQVGYGADARFVRCALDACPRPTVKTAPTKPARTAAAPLLSPDGLAQPQALFTTHSEPQPVAPTALPNTERGEPTAPSAPPAPEERPIPLAARFDARKAQPQEAAARLHLSFAFASAELSAAAKHTLRAALPEARKAERIVISGRTDSVGAEEVNARLALARALAVRNYIRDLEPSLPGVISIDARGKCCLVATNETGDGRSRNRRVEVVFQRAQQVG